MILFFDNRENIIFAVQTQKQLSNSDIKKLSWLFGNSFLVDSNVIKNTYLGPRAVMVSPWSTNAVEMTQNMGINHINRIEKYVKIDQNFKEYDPMLSEKFTELNQSIFIINIDPEPINHIDNIESYNESEGLSLSKEEVNYLLDNSMDIFEFSKECSLLLNNQFFNQDKLVALKNKISGYKIKCPEFTIVNDHINEINNWHSEYKKFMKMKIEKEGKKLFYVNFNI